MKLLVTGGAGYIGSHTVKELRKSGFKEIVVIDDLSAGDRSRIPSDIKLVKADFADKKVLNNIFAHGIDGVLHFAASKIAPESVANPIKYYENNVIKSIELINLCIEYKVKYFIFSSSAAVYGDVKEFPITESFCTKPTNPYGRTKLIIEQVLSDYARAYPIKYVSLRYFNAGGANPEGQLGNDHLVGEDLISILMTAATQNKDFTIFGADYDTDDGTCIRDLIHVTDLASAHVDALNYLKNGGDSQTINLGSEKGFSVKEIAELTKNITGRKFNIRYCGRRDGDIAVSIASSEKAKNLLGWEREYSDITTLITTAWQWENRNNKNTTS